MGLFYSDGGLKMEQKDRYFFMLSNEQLRKESNLESEGPLKQEIADLAFQNMILESELYKQKQTVADLEFTLMMGGVI